MKKHLLALLTAIAAVRVTAAPLPPNTMDMSNYSGQAQSFSQQTQSPILNQTPMDIQPFVAPSTRTMVNNEVNEYLGSNLTPQQFQQLKTLLLEQQRIAATPYNQLPNPVVRSLAVDLSPGKTPPIVRVAKNMLTSIVFTDMEGNPWYIEKVALNRNQFSDANSQSTIAAAQANTQAVQAAADTTTGSNLTPANRASSNINDDNSYTASQNANGINSSGNSDPKANLTNILTLEPKQAIDYGTVSITLRGKATPVIFLVASGQSEVDIRLDAKIAGKNPDVDQSSVSPFAAISGNSLASTPDQDAIALAFLDGNPPNDATPLTSSDGAVRGWEYNDKLYVKTRFDVLYPNFMYRAASSDGTKIYRFDQGVNDITFLQRRGQPVTVSFEQNSLPYYER